MIEFLLEKKIAAETVVIQALVGGGEKPGKELRELVNADLVEKRLGKFSGPAFYQFMAQMEERELVTHEVKPEEVEGQTIKTWWYQYTGGGTRLQLPEAAPNTSLNFGGLFPSPGTA